MAELPLAPIERIMRNSGADRVSINAIRLTALEAEKYIETLTISAKKIANSCGRKTITPDDIRIASKKLYAMGFL
ncbi:MAG: histone [Candidatus Altiarchaeales archaeon]|nr:MAG: histone [Candidatus Altiarchaeales archaeon]RLI94061.1 MAG: histone [Candidatus Altiarchaeales archaeon]RLI94827.1 MAG: histone [Candidatus Altiarchaeales archaeon]HDO82687.1 histone [Candidatus Altiarchaeales archaeon]HEX55336.1 histone [Candidatus Altiarchaeales archaeon]